MLYISEYNTVRYGIRYQIGGSEVVQRDIVFVFRQGHKPNGGAKDPKPIEQILPLGAWADLTIEVASYGTAGVRFQAHGIIYDATGNEIAQLREYLPQASFAHPTEEMAILSLIPTGFPRKIKRRFPSYNTTSGENWAEAVSAAEADSPHWATKDWWQVCKDAVV